MNALWTRYGRRTIERMVRKGLIKGLPKIKAEKPEVVTPVTETDVDAPQEHETTPGTPGDVSHVIETGPEICQVDREISNAPQVTCGCGGCSFVEK